MKAVRFIAIFSFLAVFSFFGIYAAFAQDGKETKSPSTSKEEVKPTSNKEEIKPVAAPTVEPLAVSNPTDRRYRIGKYDVLEVMVAKHPELSRGYVKLDDAGKFFMPRIEYPINAVCKTENELAAEIKKIYADTYLREPFVSVVVKEQNSTPIGVMGAVKKPGSFFTTRPLTLLELISYAGGQDVEFAGNKVIVARIGDVSGCADNGTAVNKEREIVFFSYTLNDILKGKTNPLLEPGDIVSVMDADVIYVYGNVNKEGQIKIKEPITLMQAIASAQGLKPSSKSKVRVLRQVEGSLERKELIFDLKEISQRKAEDPFLQPNDVVAISEDPTKSILRKIGNSFTNGLPSLLYRVP
jgi:polysaccharide biosynthesis/export protein